jgi:hypothetical protein
LISKKFRLCLTKKPHEGLHGVLNHPIADLRPRSIPRASTRARARAWADTRARGIIGTRAGLADTKSYMLVLFGIKIFNIFKYDVSMSLISLLLQQLVHGNVARMSGTVPKKVSILCRSRQGS